MTWNDLAKAFVKNITAFGFLATGSFVTGIGKVLAPPIAGITITTAFVAGFGIALCYLFLKSVSSSNLKRWFVSFIIVFIALLLLFAYMRFQEFIVDTGSKDENGETRIIRGFELKNEKVKENIDAKYGGNVMKALAATNYESETLFTPESKTRIMMLLYYVWTLGFTAACCAITVFTILNDSKTKPQKKPVK